jgi:DNA-binding CsgD family transcriptional regulator
VRASVLTPTQRRVLELIAAGEKTSDVCRVLRMTQNTVIFHRRGILRALDARTMAHAVALAIGRGEISAPGRATPFRVRELVEALAREVSLSVAA